MKVKEAVELLQGRLVGEADLAALYHDELMKRADVRWKSGVIPMAGFCTLLKEMNQWIVKVCKGLGKTDYQSKHLMNVFNEQAYNSAQLALKVKTTLHE